MVGLVGKEMMKMGKVTFTRKEDQSKGVGMGFMGRSPESPCQFLETHLALLAWDDLLG